MLSNKRLVVDYETSVSITSCDLILPYLWSHVILRTPIPCGCGYHYSKVSLLFFSIHTLLVFTLQYQVDTVTVTVSFC